MFGQKGLKFRLVRTLAQSRQSSHAGGDLHKRSSCWIRQMAEEYGNYFLFFPFFAFLSFLSFFPFLPFFFAMGTSLFSMFSSQFSET